MLTWIKEQFSRKYHVVCNGKANTEAKLKRSISSNENVFVISQWVRKCLSCSDTSTAGCTGHQTNGKCQQSNGCLQYIIAVINSV